MPSAGTTGWPAARLVGWLTGWNRLRRCKPERTNRGTARRETGQLEPELCYRGAGPGRRRGFTWTAGEIRRPTLHVKYCTIKCRTHRSQSIPPYLHVPSPIPFSTTVASPSPLLLRPLLLLLLLLATLLGCSSVSLRIRSAGNLVSSIEPSMPSHCWVTFRVANAGVEKDSFRGNAVEWIGASEGVEWRRSRRGKKGEMILEILGFIYPRRLTSARAREPVDRRCWSYLRAICLFEDRLFFYG